MKTLRMLSLLLLICFLLGSCKKSTTTNNNNITPSQNWTCTCTDQNGNRSSRTIPSATHGYADTLCNSYEFNTGTFYTTCSLQ